MPSPVPVYFRPHRSARRLDRDRPSPLADFLVPIDPLNRKEFCYAT